MNLLVLFEFTSCSLLKIYRSLDQTVGQFVWQDSFLLSLVEGGLVVANISIGKICVNQIILSAPYASEFGEYHLLSSKYIIVIGSLWLVMEQK